MYLVDDEVLFTGDSLSWDPDRDDLWAEQYVCWWSWADQLDSLERLTDHRFVRIVPTHGAISPALDTPRRCATASAAGRIPFTLPRPPDRQGP